MPRRQCPKCGSGHVNVDHRDMVIECQACEQESPLTALTMASQPQPEEGRITLDRQDWLKVVTAAEESAVALDRLAGLVDFTRSEEDIALFRRIRDLQRGSLSLYHDARRSCRVIP